MIPELLVGLALACAIGVPLAIIGALVAELAEHGRRRKPAPPWRRWARPLADRARRLRMPPAPAPATWDRIRAGMSRPPRYVDTSRTLAEMNGPIATDAEVDEEFERMPLAPMRDCCMALEDELHTPACLTSAPAVPMSPDPAPKPFTGWQVPDDWRLPGGRDLMFTRPNKQPWLTGTMPAIPAPEPSGPDRAWDPGDGLGPQVPIARPYAPSPTWGEACELDVAEAERQFAMLALGPDGCEET